jgi:hypothetical protein
MIGLLDAAMRARHPIIPFLGQERCDFMISGGGKLPVDTTSIGVVQDILSVCLVVAGNSVWCYLRT